jgi:PhzF family phenazine biosynthesis protein
MKTPFFQADAFTHFPYAGNPAAVCLLTEAQPDHWMQAVAAEMNLSETAFLLPEGDGYRLRWFTPKVEVDLCGHATLASAHVLWEAGIVEPQEMIRFYTRSGLLTATREGQWVKLNFPVQNVQNVPPPPDLLEALGVAPSFIGWDKADYFIEVASEEIVRNMQPDFTRLAKVKTRGVIVTSASSMREYDFVSRFFAPAVGINEDPVTGSAHCSLTPYWANKLGKNEMYAFQASSRGGEIKVHLEGDRVVIAGQAVTVISGELLG